MTIIDTSSNRLQELDSIRGLAALAVVLFHYGSHYPVMMPDMVGTGLYTEWGKFGVEIFFGISGFVIFMTLRRTRTASDFLISRFTRLFPAYWLGILLTTLIVQLLGATSLYVSTPATLFNFTMLQGHFGIPLVDGAYWSLSVELSFYVLMLLFWKLKWLEKIEWILLGWVALKLLWWAFPGLSWRVSDWLIIGHIPYFSIGILAYRIWSGERSWRRQLPYLIAIGVTVYCIDPLPQSVAFLFSAGCFALLAANKLTLLRQRPLLWLGSVSYPLYLLHQHIGLAMMARMETSGVPAIITLVVTLVTVIGLAALATNLVERPALHYIRAAWARRQIAVR